MSPQPYLYWPTGYSLALHEVTVTLSKDASVNCLTTLGTSGTSGTGELRRPTQRPAKVNACETKNAQTPSSPGHSRDLAGFVVCRPVRSRHPVSMARLRSWLVAG